MSNLIKFDPNEILDDIASVGRGYLSPIPFDGYDLYYSQPHNVFINTLERFRRTGQRIEHIVESITSYIIAVPKGYDIPTITEDPNFIWLDIVYMQSLMESTIIGKYPQDQHPVILAKYSRNGAGHTEFEILPGLFGLDVRETMVALAQEVLYTRSIHQAQQSN